MKSNWKIKKLGEICSFQNGYAFKSSEYIDSGSFVMRIGNVQDGYITLNDPKYIGTTQNIYNKFSLSSGDILISLTGNVGRVGIIKESHLPAVINQRVARINIKGDIQKDFLLYFLLSSSFKESLINAGHGAAQQNISTKDIEIIDISIPPIQEQQRIVSILDKALEGIEQVKINTENNLMNTAKIFESYMENIFLIQGKDLEAKKLGEIATFRNGLNFTKGSKGEIIKIAGVKDFQKSFWVPFDSLESVIIDGKLNDIDYLNEGDIIAVRSNGNPKLIGRVLLAGQNKNKVSHSGFTIRIRLNSNIISPIYLCYYLKTQKTRKQLVESGTGINIKSLNQNALSLLLIPFPKSIKEQQIIVDNLDNISKETKNLEVIYRKKLDYLDELKKSILTKAFNGEL